ncbi:MAG: class I SAM-dependent methyltransferase [Candidatus Eutrophobiaceae bacterium]
MGIRDLLRHPLVRDIDPDKLDRLQNHKRMLTLKPMLREIFEEFHQVFKRLDERFFTVEGQRVELGAGALPLKVLLPEVLATDVCHSSDLDVMLDAGALPFPESSVRAIYAQNCFHHFPHPEEFFRELERVLPVGGGAILIEPYHGWFASIFYGRLFRMEGFDKKAKRWDSAIPGVMSSANQALSYVIFSRDRERFQQQHPNLRIVHRELCANYLKYMLSGGWNFRQALPNFAIPLVEAVQFLLRPLNRFLALHYVVVFVKT